MRKPRWRLTVLFAAVIILLVFAAFMVVERPLTLADARLRLELWRGGVKSRYLDANGLHMHYFEAMPQGGGGTPLVLVHGLGARGEDWVHEIAPLAAAGFHVYAPDLPGYGRSAHPADASYTIAYEEAAVAGFIKQVGVVRTDVAGWSMGGWVSMKLAADHPELVDRLVLYDSAGVYFPIDYDSSLFVPIDKAGVERLFNRLTPHPLRLPGFVERDLLRRIGGNAWVTRRSMAGMTSGRDLMEFRLGQIREPTLVMWGTADTLIPISAGRKIARGIPGATLVPIVGCGHLAPAECSNQVLPATIAFLRGQTPPGSVNREAEPANAR